MPLEERAWRCHASCLSNSNDRIFRSLLVDRFYIGLWSPNSGRYSGRYAAAIKANADGKVRIA